MPIWRIFDFNFLKIAGGMAGFVCSIAYCLLVPAARQAEVFPQEIAPSGFGQNKSVLIILQITHRLLVVYELKYCGVFTAHCAF